MAKEGPSRVERIGAKVTGAEAYMKRRLEENITGLVRSVDEFIELQEAKGLNAKNFFYEGLSLFYAYSARFSSLFPHLYGEYSKKFVSDPRVIGAAQKLADEAVSREKDVNKAWLREEAKKRFRERLQDPIIIS